MEMNAKPILDKINIFENQKGGYVHYRVPGIVVTTKGILLAYCEARMRGDWGDIDIMMRRSTDGGRTWGERQEISKATGEISKNPVALQQNLATKDELTLHNPVMIVDHKTGTIHFLYCAEYARCFYRRSNDDGKTFSEPVDITDTFEKFRSEYDWKVIATGPGHGIQLKNGRLIVPVWMSTGTGGHGHRPSCVSVIYSDDHGKTFHRGEIVTCDPDPLVNPSESVALQLTDGRVMLNIRNESKVHRRAVSYSADGATGWTMPVFDEELFEPICMASIIRLTEQPKHEKNRILFSNPDSRLPHVRRNLSIKLSYDEGETWPVSKTLEPDISGYSDLTVGSDGTIYCIYETDRNICVARFNLEWLTDGRDTLKALRAVKRFLSTRVQRGRNDQKS